MTDEPELLAKLDAAIEHFENAPDERFFPAHLYEWTSEAASLLQELRDAWNNRPTLFQSVGERERALEEAARACEEWQPLAPDTAEQDVREAGLLASSIAYQIRKLKSSPPTLTAPVGEEAVERAAVLWAREDCASNIEGSDLEEKVARYRSGFHDGGLGIQTRVRAFMAGAASISSMNGLREALEPFARIAIGQEIIKDRALVLYKNGGQAITVGDILNARAALNSPPAGLIDGD